MSQINPENVKGVVRNTDKTSTVILTNGEKRKVDNSTASSLVNRLDKDRSRSEKEQKRK